MINIPVVSYGAGGLFYFVLGLLLISGWRGRGVPLVLAVFYSALWCVFLAINEASMGWSFSYLYWLEIPRYGLWTFFLMSLLSGGIDVFPRYRLLLIGIVALYGMAVISGIALYQGRLLHIDSLPVMPAVSLLLLILSGLALIEQFYRNTPVDKRWAIKFLCLGLGVLLAYDFYMYAHAMLFRQLDWVAWAARGSVNALVVPLIAVAIARNPQWSLDIFVSRHIVFYSASIVAAGVYLLAMALGGYYIRIYGGNWGTFLQLVFLVGAGLLLFVIMMSTQLRSRLKLFVSEHFFSNKYDYRREWLRLIDTLSGPAGELTLYQRMIKAVCQIVEARGGVLWVNQGGLYYIPVANWEADATDCSIADSYESLAGYLKSDPRVLDLTCIESNNIGIPEHISQRENAWLIIPLLYEERILGFMLLERSDYSPGITWEDEDLLKTVGKQVASYLVQYETGRQLLDARQFETYHQLSTFIVHDLKNIISQLSLVVQNATAHKQNPAFIEDAIETTANAVRYMSRLIAQLQAGPVAGEVQEVNLKDLVDQAIRQCSSRDPVPEVGEFDQNLRLWIDGERLTMMLRHLIHNAQDATAVEGEIVIRCRVDGDYIVLEVADSGCGMDRNFINERLFSPFDSTKGTKGMGIGAYEVREFVRSQGGDVLVKSELGKGTVFTLLLPQERFSGPRVEEITDR